MKIINDSPIHVKLLLGFGTVLSLSFLTIILTLTSFNKLYASFNEIVDYNARAIKLMPDLMQYWMELAVKEKELLTVSSSERHEIISSIKDNKEELMVRLGEIKKLNSDQASLSDVDQFSKAIRDYELLLLKLNELLDNGKDNEALILSNTEGKNNVKLLNNLNKKISDKRFTVFELSKDKISEFYNQQYSISVALMVLAFFLTPLIIWIIGRLIVSGIKKLVVTTQEITSGNLETKIEIESKDEIGQLANSITTMQSALLEIRSKAENLDWLKSGVARMNTVVLGQEDKLTLASTVLNEVADYLDAKIAAFFIADTAENGVVLNLLATYAYTQRKNLSSQFKLGENLVGQAALERKQILLQNVPEDYIRVASGLGETTPTNICVTPILFERNLRGVLEIGTLKPLTTLELNYLEQVCIPVALALEISQAQTIMKVQQEELSASNDELEQQMRTLELAQKELKAQQVELETTNNELQAQMQRVKDSEEELKAQQEELQATNRELTDKNKLLEHQKGDIENARRNLEVQSQELTLASKYKSEFLANMSHELRTPLNSLLLLARTLVENKTGNLNDDQIETAGVIYESGSDLLNLINEILDLSKIEAGRMDLRLQPVELTELMRSINLQFEPMARNQHLALEVDCEADLPSTIITDAQRLGQIIKNLMGNALKFTESGSVSIRFKHTPADTDLSKSGLDHAATLTIAVKDTGIGIPLDKQKIIFEAFQQADSGDRRRYGGTGLGLSISRELAGLLGGEIQLVSHPGEGSTFSVYIPFVLSKPQTTEAAVTSKTKITSSINCSVPTTERTPAEPIATLLEKPEIIDDRDNISDQDRVVLIIEDDARFANILANESRERGFKCLIALTGEEGLQLASQFRPDGIVLDLILPNMDGWDVLNNLKQNVDTRHIPVHIVSSEDASSNSLKIGAIGHACKPVRKEDIDVILARLEQASAHAEKWVLLVEDDEMMRKETKRVIGNGNVKVREVGSGQEALDALHERDFALVILDLGLPDMQGLDLLKFIAQQKISLPPVIVYTVRELTMDEEIALRNYADSIILKDVRSQERLIDEVALFLHRVVNELPEDKKRVIRHLHESDEHLKGRKILIVEDDMRTMFAMTKVLASHGINPIKAENGQKALDILRVNPDVDLILMDMMMPVMDGYEAMQQIRAQSAFVNLPIIALTAKAMKEDRKKCLEAGATDYLSKPVDMDRLLSLVRVWLCR